MCILSILNNTNFSNRHWLSLPKYRPARTIYSQQSDYNHSGPVHNILQQTAPHSSAWQNIRFVVEQALID